MMLKKAFWVLVPTSYQRKIESSYHCKLEVGNWIGIGGGDRDGLLFRGVGSFVPGYTVPSV